LAAITAPARAELPPEIGYVFPAGGRAGEAIDVVLGGYDWTSDVEILPHDPGVTLAITGAPTRVLIPDPPHLFGFKARANDRPCPREFPARLALPADLAPGIHRFQVANANGASPPGAFHVSRHPAVREARAGAEVQTLPGLPLVVDGRIARHEEIDRYRFTVPADGPVWVDVVARRVQSALPSLVKLTDLHVAAVLRDPSTVASARPEWDRDFWRRGLAELRRELPKVAPWWRRLLGALDPTTTLRAR